MRLPASAPPEPRSTTPELRAALASMCPQSAVGAATRSRLDNDPSSFVASLSQDLKDFLRPLADRPEWDKRREPCLAFRRT